MGSHSMSVVGRAVLALGLMAGFYGIAIGMTAVLIYVPYAEVVYANRLHVKLAVFCLAGAMVILAAIIPRRDRFEPPGPRVMPGREPELFEVIRQVAEATGQRMPSEVYVIGEVNAWVAQCGGWMGLGGKRVMGLGLPMLRALTVPEFQAVLAHEFGHVHGGDTRLGRIVYQTRAAIGRTVAGLAEQESWLQIPFLTYARLFLRVSHAVSRSQESTADRLAASIVGRGALAEGLRKIHGAAFVYERYWNDEVRAVVEAGYLPPLMEGFGRYLSGEVGVALARAAVEHAVASEEADIYDTHPPLRERLEALGNFPGGMDASAAGRRSNSSGTCGRWSRSCSVGHWRQPRAGR